MDPRGDAWTLVVAAMSGHWLGPPTAMGTWSPLHIMPSSKALSAVLLFTAPQSLLEEEVPGVQDARKLQLTAGRFR